MTMPHQVVEFLQDRVEKTKGREALFRGRLIPVSEIENSAYWYSCFLSWLREWRDENTALRKMAQQLLEVLPGEPDVNKLGEDQ